MSKKTEHDDIHGDTIVSGAAGCGGDQYRANHDQFDRGVPSSQTESVATALVEVNPVGPSTDPADRIIFSDDIGKGGMAIMQDGDLRARTALPEALFNDVTETPEFRDTTWGAGLYGAFGGASVSGEIGIAP